MQSESISGMTARPEPSTPLPWEGRVFNLSSTGPQGGLWVFSPALAGHSLSRSSSEREVVPHFLRGTSSAHSLHPDGQLPVI